MKPSQAEFLLRLAENSNEAGEEVIAEMRRMGMEHAHRLLQELDLLNSALELNRLDRERFAQYMPRPPQSLQSALQQGPRAAIAGGKDETQAQAKDQRQRAATAGQQS
jgi:hypothetical protein